MSLNRIATEAEEARRWKEAKDKEGLVFEGVNERELYEELGKDLNPEVGEALSVRATHVYEGHLPKRWQVPDSYLVMRVGVVRFLLKLMSMPGAEERSWDLSVSAGPRGDRAPVEYHYEVSGGDLQNELLAVVQEYN